MMSVEHHAYDDHDEAQLVQEHESNHTFPATKIRQGKIEISGSMTIVNNWRCASTRNEKQEEKLY